MEVSGWGGDHDPCGCHVEGFNAAVGEQGEQVDDVEVGDEAVD
ncbi:MAG: hypothetical protein ACYCTE_09950 [Acidimicrobiales bacterium]